MQAKRGVVLVLGGLGLLLAFRWLGWWGEPAHTPRVHNQIWIEREPRDERDLVRHLVLVEDEDRRFGATGCSSAWRLAVDLVRWRARGPDLRIEYPQERKHADFRTRAWHCAGEAPKPFELCLELERRGKKQRYFSREDWVLAREGELAETVPAHVRAAIGALDAATIGEPGAATEDLEEDAIAGCPLD